MPLADGRLTHAEAHRCNEQFGEYETAQGHDVLCEVCGGIVWVLLPYVLSFPVDSPAGPIGSTRRSPVISYSCVKCGNMKFFPATKWEVGPVPDTEEGAETEEEKAPSQGPPPAQGT